MGGKAGNREQGTEKRGPRERESREKGVARSHPSDGDLSPGAPAGSRKAGERGSRKAGTMHSQYPTACSHSAVARSQQPVAGSQ